MEMQLKQGAQVVTADGHDVGSIDRVVMDPRTKEVTHLVVRKGFLFTEDKVVPLNLIAAATEDRVRLREDAGDLQALPDFEETHYLPVGEEEVPRSYTAGYVPPFYWYPPIGVPTAAAGYPGYITQPYVTETEQNIPESSVALQAGAKVISADGQEVGSVERILTDPRSDRASHFLISQGLLLKERKLIPITWVDSVGEDKVHLAVGSGLLNALREYQT
jgi:uncharacterized protein YrrD